MHENYSRYFCSCSWSKKLRPDRWTIRIGPGVGNRAVILLGWRLLPFQTKQAIYPMAIKLIFTVLKHCGTESRMTTVSTADGKWKRLPAQNHTLSGSQSGVVFNYICGGHLLMKRPVPSFLPFESSELVSLALCPGVVRVVAKAHSKSLIDPSVCKHWGGQKEASAWIPHMYSDFRQDQR